MVPIQMQSYYSLFPQWRLSTRSFRTLTIGLSGRHGAQHLRATCLPSPLAADDTLGKDGGMIKARAVPDASKSVLAPVYVCADMLATLAIKRRKHAVGRHGHRTGFDHAASFS